MMNDSAEKCIPAFSAINAYLHNPVDGQTAFSIANGGQSFYENLNQTADSEGSIGFHKFMELKFASQRNSLEVAPFKEYISSGLEKRQGAAFVDVGGGRGQQCAALLELYPELSGKVLLQDSQEVLDGVEIEGVKNMPHDFFKEQPIEGQGQKPHVKDISSHTELTGDVGAAFYYMRQILHNYTGERCLHLLRNLHAAMDDSSMLLIDEAVVPQYPAPHIAGLGMSMVALFASFERNEKQWEALLSDAGFKIVGIINVSEDGQSLIQAVKN
jgi:demethylsterigmatocystin 6-O-methyltransferase